MSELHANQSENIGERNDQLLSEHIEQQDSKLEQIIEQLDEIKVLLLGKTHKRCKSKSDYW